MFAVIFEVKPRVDGEEDQALTAKSTYYLNRSVACI